MGGNKNGILQLIHLQSLPHVNDASVIARQPHLGLWLSPEHLKRGGGTEKQTEFTVNEDDEMRFSRLL